jgi:hypothetical protein
LNTVPSAAKASTRQTTATSSLRRKRASTCQTTSKGRFTAVHGAITGSETLFDTTQPNYFAKYEKDKLLLAAEYSRNWTNQWVQLPGTSDTYSRGDDRGWYAMVSYKLKPKLATGFYVSQNADHQAPVSSARHYNEWVISGRYDLYEFLYAKAEEHFINGTGLAFDQNLNPDLQPKTALTILKVGVSF